MSKLFGGSPAPTKTTNTAVDTLVGRQTEVSGDIRFTGGLHVDGKVKGKVMANSDKSASLSVSDSGMIEGDVRVPNVVLNGAVVGDVHAAERIRLSSKARVTGNVYYKILEMEAGATVNGQLVHESGDALAPVGAGKAVAGNDGDAMELPVGAPLSKLGS